jgi:multisubunit Na+/H+ antiporter MnhE subunit
MSELTVRLLLVVSVVTVSLVLIGFLRKKSTTARTIKKTNLAPGLYFLTSQTCADCAPVRRVLKDRYGDAGFVEYSWESDREILESLRVDLVPSTLWVDKSGSGKIWPGAPDAMFSVVDP